MLSRRSFLLGFALPGPPEGTDVRVLQTFAAINDIRRRHRLGELAWSNPIAAAARSHAERMRAAGFFSHDDPKRGDLKSRLSAARVSWRFCAENLFFEEGYDDSAAEAVRGWMKSPGHRANILNAEPTQTGIGLATDSGGRVWIVQIFMLPH